MQKTYLSWIKIFLPQSNECFVISEMYISYVRDGSFLSEVHNSMLKTLLSLLEALFPMSFLRLQVW